MIDNAHFKAHEGFDLAAWDETDGEPVASPRLYKVRKASKFQEFVNQVAGDLGQSPDLVRLWTMVNRQNKTVRPDIPIGDLDASEWLVLIPLT